MTYPAQTVKEFISDSYQIVSANSPTVPLQGSDQIKALNILNRLLAQYSATSLLILTPQEINFTININQQAVTFTDPAYVLPTPNPSVPNIAEGRLSNLQNGWLLLDGVTYPMKVVDRNTFKSSYKYDPLDGLPRFLIPTYYDDYTYLRIYPAPSQAFTLFIFGKFQLSALTLNVNVSVIPSWQHRFLQFALAKDLSIYKSRASAWTELLESEYTSAKQDMESASPINVNIESDYESYLNGAWRVRSGV